MDLIKLEFKKLFTPLTVVVLAVMLTVNMYAAFMHQGVFYAGERRSELYELKAREREMRGAIDDEWIAARNAEVQAVLSAPEYQKNEEELEELHRHMCEEGLSEALIEEQLAVPYNRLNAEGIGKYEQTEPYIVAANFYNHAEMKKQDLLNEYAGDEAVCADITERYDRLINDYTAFYDYSLAYENIQYAAANMLHLTIGIPVLVGLAPLFARERARRTDALLLSSKRGRHELARAKICAGALFAALVWLIMAASVTVYALLFFGTQGYGGLWQSFTDITSPLLWTIGQAVVIELLTCLAGTLFFAFAVMLISELSRSMFLAVILAAALLLTPMFLDLTAKTAVFLPTFIMRGVAIWSSYLPSKLFGSVVPRQYLALAAAAVLSGVCAAASVRVFASSQAR